MMIQKLNIEKIVLNPANPRIIKNDRFKKLVKSIKEFPEMLDLRPIILNGDNMILGGNMRLKAAKEAGLKEVPVIVANTLSDEQQKEFVIKDNINSGEWDWDVLKEAWEDLDLGDWGLDTNFLINDDLDNFDVELPDNEVKKNPSATDEGYSAFELVMVYENKIELMKILNAVREKHRIEKLEDALMEIVKSYKL